MESLISTIRRKGVENPAALPREVGTALQRDEAGLAHLPGTRTLRSEQRIRRAGQQGDARRIGVLLLAAMLVVGCYWFLHRLPGPRPSPDMSSADPILDRVILMLRAMGDYTGLVFWPAHLHMERMLGSTGPYANLSAGPVTVTVPDESGGITPAESS